MVLAACLGGAAPASAEKVLERVVLVQRHGVRAPTQSPETLAAWSPRPWPNWPVPRGELTPHGREVVGLVSDAIRSHYVRAGLLPAEGCPGNGLVVWADGKDQRTRESGQAMADRLAPGCGVVAQHGPDGAVDPLFHGLQAACKLDPDAASAAVLAVTGTRDDLADPASAAAVRRIWDVLGRRDAPGPSSFKADAHGIRLTGPLSVAASASEVFVLEYAENMPLADVAWGTVPAPDALAPLLASRIRATNLTRRLPYLARREGGRMAHLMLATLAGAPRAAEPTLGLDVRLLALAGHDTNLSQMAGVFGVEWSLPGQPDPTAPATAFALERWRDPSSGAVSVALTLWYGELDGLRRLDQAKVHGVPISLPGCPNGDCPLEALSARILAEIPADCR
ncbi:histidine-type phosphatase [Aquabacter spiritensis]|uniref:4-phytase/acid phosphatase n=1 Tax=Aquabacter spiritensis TaxID=933073 RepID=A0A4R3M1V5_9HYPH|nr:histidine-type phosphatase [Aquabacter spiritensis]TCT05085.1 4-phytase/acid phosphatase [Aquabacter spiritensis]